MLPAVHGVRETQRQILLYSVALVVCTLFLVPIAGMGLLYLASALLLGAGFLAFAVRLWRQATIRTSRALFAYSLLYLGLLYVSAGVDPLLHW